MRNIIVKASEIARAIEKSYEVDTRSWQAECIEILLIPKVYKRWQRINKAKFGGNIEISRVDGQAYTNDIDGHKVDDWSAFGGYLYGYGLKGLCWNSVRETSYSHSASTAWDGIRRETYHSFAENLRHLYLSLVDDKVQIRKDYVESQLYPYRITFFNDLDGDVVEGYHSFEEFYTEAEAVCKLDGELARLGNRVKSSSVRKMEMSGMWRVTIETTRKPNLSYVSRKMIAA